MYVISPGKGAETAQQCGSNPSSPNPTSNQAMHTEKKELAKNCSSKHAGPGYAPSQDGDLLGVWEKSNSLKVPAPGVLALTPL